MKQLKAPVLEEHHFRENQPNHSQQTQNRIDSILKRLNRYPVKW